MTAERTALPAPAPRRERRKQEARERLLDAARAHLATHGETGLRISDITEAADLGFGTFYSHFDSKEEMVEAVIADAIATASERIGTRALELADPAETASFSYRRFVAFAVEEPALAQLLVNITDAPMLFENSVRPWAYETLRRGQDSGRFAIPDIELALTSIAAAAIATIRAVLSGRVPPESATAGAEMMLRGFGLDGAEAHELARRPLPPMEDARPQG